MDTATLRVAFGVVAVCVLILFYGATYRTTRAPYCGWWSLSMALFVTSALLFLLNGTPVQAVANPVANALAVAGGSCVWAAASSLHQGRPPWWQLSVAPSIVLAVSALDDPARDVWAGGGFFLAAMSVSFGFATWHLACVLRSPGSSMGSWAAHRFAITSLFAMSAAVTVYYGLRCGVFVAVGPSDPLFRYAFGSQATTLLTMAMLVVVTFSMSALSHLQQTTELRAQASHDGLTGLLNRTEFLRRAGRMFDDPAVAEHGAVLVADIDDFKGLNDSLGHAAGDRALIVFAAACQSVVGDRGVVGRIGGDEFGLVLPEGELAEPTAIEIARQYRHHAAGMWRSSVSFGIAAVDADAGVKDTIIRADVALYQAKAAGRDRVVRYDALHSSHENPPVRPTEPGYPSGPVAAQRMRGRRRVRVRRRDVSHRRTEHGGS